MHPTNPAGPVPAYKTCTACCSFYLEAVSLQRSPHSKCKWMGLGMECQNQGMDAILDQSTRCQPWMHTATPLWMLSCMQGQLKCHRAGIHCGPLCKCEWGCTNNDMETWSVLKTAYRLHSWIIFLFNQCILDCVNIKVHDIVTKNNSWWTVHSYVVPKIIATWYDYFQLHLVYYIGQFLHVIVKFLVNRDSKVCKNWKGVKQCVYDPTSSDYIYSSPSYDQLVF